MSDFWIQTYTGVAFDLAESSPEDVYIEDIAHALAYQCRYNGHCRHFYSVAQHSVLVSLEVEAAARSQLDLFDDGKVVKDLALWGLLHDACEAYIGDLVAPVKKMLAHGVGESEFDWLEEYVQKLVIRRFGLSAEQPALVKEYDLRLLATERRDLMGQCHRLWSLPYPPLDRRIVGADPRSAENEFLRRFDELDGRGPR